MATFMLAPSPGNVLHTSANCPLPAQSINPAELPWLSTLTPPYEDSPDQQHDPKSLQKPSYQQAEATESGKPDATPSQPPPQAQRTRRTRRLSSLSSSAETISPERAKHLERNRISANKCRLKKKKEHARMESILNFETRKRDALLSEVGLLKDELWCLKNMIFEHAQCDNPHVNYQLARMTEQVLSKSPASAASVSPVFATKSQADGSAFSGGGGERPLDSFGAAAAGGGGSAGPALSSDMNHVQGYSETMFENLVDIS
ncbi:BZIP transcription factor [Penicillium ucsense]|uniref:BZIP transcription factor n=1 Tax=Penicillium ucsense TaxID=2839758 RepID=A0A8J8WF12_9EURO|nr:BZIP transcription factor [Penicillium ucsense]KAF7729404.1 BZIP transcription factor [Penicillium ucsense]